MACGFASGVAAYGTASPNLRKAIPAVSGVAHSLASKTSSVLSFNVEDIDNE